MPLSFGQCGAGDIGTGTSVTSASKTTSATGSAFLICTSGKSAAINAVPTDSFGNTYTLLASSIGGVFGSDNAYIYGCFGGTGGSGHTATAVYAATTPADVHLIEIPGASALDVAAPATTNTTGSSTTLAGAPITTVTAATAVVSYYAGYGGGSAAITDTGTGFSILTQTGGTSTVNSAVSGRIVSAAGTYQDTYTITAFDYGAFLTVSLKGSSSGSALAANATDTTSASATIASHHPTIGAHTVATATTPTTLTTGAVTTQATGSSFVITIHSRGASLVPPTSVADSFSNTYTLKESNTAGGYGDIWVGMYVCDGGAGGSGHTATVVWSAAPQISDIYLTEVIGAANPSFDVGANTYSNAGAETYPGASVTTTAPNDLVLSFWGGLSGGSSTVTDSGTGFSILDQTGGASSVINSALSTCVASTTGTYQDTYNFSVYDYGGFVAIALKAVTGAALASAASDTTSATGKLTVGLGAAATDTTSATGNLTTQAKFAATAGDTTGATAALTNYATVTLTNPLSSGTGTLFDPNGPAWSNGAPPVGAVVYYDPTYASVAVNGVISATSNNFSFLAEWNNGGSYSQRIFTFTPYMVAYATDTTSASATLSGSGIAANASDTTSATGTLSSGTALAAGAADTTAATGSLTVRANFAAAAADVTSATGALSLAVALLASANDATSATGTLTTKANLSGAASDTTSASATLAGAVALAAAAADLTTAVASLTTLLSIGANASDATAATGTLSLKAALAASATDLTSASGALTTQAALLAAANDSSSATAVLSVLNALEWPARVIATPYVTPSAAAIAGPSPYAEYFQYVGEMLTYAIDWDGFLANYWQAGANVPATLCVRPTVPNGFEYVTAAGGSSGPTEPAWPTTVGQSITDGAVTWTCQPMDTTSLGTTLASAVWTPAEGITVSNSGTTGQMAIATLNSAQATAGTSYTVNCAATMSDGEVKVGRIVLKVR